MTFRWAIVGTSGVSAKFAHGLASLPGDATAARVVSRKKETARAFAARFGIRETVEGMGPEAFEGVDAVYIATPANLHAEHALAAIQAGTPVLLEKPFATTAEDAQRIAEAAQTAGVFCMEALWTRFLPITTAIRQQVALGTLGTLTSFDGSFQGANEPDASQSLFNPSRGGGALLQRGIYPLSLARQLLGPIQTVVARGRIGDTGVDEDCALMLTHASGAVSTIRASARVNGPNAAVLTGTQGTIEIAAPIWRPGCARLTRTVAARGGSSGPRKFEGLRESGPAQRLSQALGPIKTGIKTLLGRGGAQTLRAPFSGNGYGHQAQAVMDALAGGQTESALMPMSESVEILRVMDEARAQIASHSRGEASP